MGEPAKPKRRWLKMLGLAPSDPAPDTWLPLATAAIDDLDKGLSTTASEMVSTLEAAGISARQKRYVIPDRAGWFGSGPDVQDRIRIAVLVQGHDMIAAKAQIHSFNTGSSSAEMTAEHLASLALHDVPFIDTH